MSISEIESESKVLAYLNDNPDKSETMKAYADAIEQAKKIGFSVRRVQAEDDRLQLYCELNLDSHKHIKAAGRAQWRSVKISNNQVVLTTDRHHTKRGKRDAVMMVVTCTIGLLSMGYAFYHNLAVA